MIRINETINLCNPIYCYNVIDDKNISIGKVLFSDSILTHSAL